MLAGALFYMIGSTLGVAALFLVVELVDRGQSAVASMLALSADLYGTPEETSDEEQSGITVPATMALLSAAFAAIAIILAGLPPFTGFLGKVMILGAMLKGSLSGSGLSWVFMAVLIVSGLATLIALLRVGVQTFWTPSEEEEPRVLAQEMLAILVLVGLVALMTWQARPVMRYMEATAAALHQPQIYIDGVLLAERTYHRQEEGE